MAASSTQFNAAIGHRQHAVQQLRRVRRGIYNYVGTLTVTGSTFSDNSATLRRRHLQHFGILYLGTSKFSGNTPDEILGGYINLGGNTFHLGVRAGDALRWPPARGDRASVAADRVREPVAPEPVVRRVRVYAG